jgi:hypothetical protein
LKIDVAADVFAHSSASVPIIPGSEAGAIDEDPVQGAEDILLLERIRKMLPG